LRRQQVRVGHLSYKHLVIFAAVVLISAASGVAAGFQEYEFFTEWNTARYASLDPVWILNQWNWYCVAMFAIDALTSLGPALIAFLIYGRVNRVVVLLLVAGLTGILVWIVAEDLTAHLLYGRDPAGDWNDWIFESRVRLASDYWLPTWYFLLIAAAALLFLVYAFKGSRWGRRRRKRR